MPFEATPDAIARAKNIKILLFDVDGVLTDGSIWVFPKPERRRPPTLRA